MVVDVKKLTIKNTKQQMLDAYSDLLQKLEEKREAELKPEKKAEEQKTQRAVEKANTISMDGVARGIGDLKSELNKTFANLLEKLETELSKYDDLKQAVVAKEKELAEIYEIQKAASSLAALIEAQNQRRREFEHEMEDKKQILAAEIEAGRSEWNTEKSRYEAELRKKREEDEKQRKREKEEYEYNFKREQVLAKDKLEDEKARVEKELVEKKERAEKELSERENTVAEREKKIDVLENRIRELETKEDAVVKSAVKEATEKLTAEFHGKELLLKKEFEGERNVLTTRINALEELVKKQNEQISKLTQQLEKASSQVQDIAVKSIEGAAHSKLFSELQNLLQEGKRQEGEGKGKSELK
ncbi:MAG: hypothetical protein GWP06_09830 [Actinobacteria bacterium]|nr:hypothetical protein [Actinomycetota bacterium]